MALATASLVSEPGKLEPVNGNIWYKLQSTNSSLYNDYKYVLDLWEVNRATGATSSLISRFKFPPRPVDNFGWLSVNKALKPFIINNTGIDVCPVNITALQAVTSLYCRYTATFGFEYNPNIEYADFVSSPAFGIAISTNEGFQVGDEITINKTNNIINSQYNGTKIIGSVSGGTVSIPGLTGSWYWYGLNGTFGESTPPYYDGGLITNVIRVRGTASTRLGYNGTRQYDQNTTNFYTNYAWDGTNTPVKFLTNYNNYHQYKRIGYSEYETMNLFYDQVASTTLLYTLTKYGSGFNVLSTINGNVGLLLPPPAFGQRYWAVPVGTKNFATSFAGVSYYKLTFFKSGGTPTMVDIWRKIDGECSLYDTVRMVFLNRMGGYDYFSFTKDNKKTVNINRTEYKQVLQPDYSIGDRGDTVLAQDVQYTFTVNSNWITEGEYAWLEELVTSPEVYYITEDYGSPLLIPIVITDTNYAIKTQLRDKLFNLTINYKLSYPINVANY
jgi:hypothetical protein